MRKKVISFILICTVALSMSACKAKDLDREGTDSASGGKNETSVKNDSKADTNKASSSNTDTVLPPLGSSEPKSQKGVETYVESLISTNFQKMDIDTLTVLQNHGTPETNDYKVYTMISWSEEMDPEDSRTTLEGYSTTIAEMINANCDNVTELSLVWLVPNLPGRGNVKYIKMDGFMSLSDLSFDSKFGTSTDTTEGAISPTDATIQ